MLQIMYSYIGVQTNRIGEETYMYTFIINPTAGNGYGKQIEPQLRERMDASGKAYQVVYTSCAGDATTIAAKAAAAHDCQAVISVGGDGTAFETACGLVGTGVPMGIIPAGTGNDFIKSTGTPKDPLEALQFILTHQPRPVDFGRANDKSFINVSGTGFDIQVLDCTEKFKKHFKGLIPYMLGLLQAIFTYKPVHLEVVIDGQEINQDFLICSVANGKIFGGGIPICPPARIDDGLLDVVMVRHIPRWRIPFFLPALMMGKLTEVDLTTHVMAKEVTMRSKGMRFNMDGEVAPIDEVHLSVQPGALMLYW